jgi:predicted kinase
MNCATISSEPLTSDTSTMPNLIVIGGAPAAGKSTLARALREALAWPLLAKDDIKELLFDVLGSDDRAHSKRLSAAAYAIMFATAKELMQARQSCIVEGNFRWSERQADFASLATAVSGLRLLQIFVTADPDELARRFEARAGARHPGHVDAASAAEIIGELRTSPPRPLPLGGELIEFRSDEMHPAARDALIAQVRAWVSFPLPKGEG